MRRDLGPTFGSLESSHLKSASFWPLHASFLAGFADAAIIVMFSGFRRAKIDQGYVGMFSIALFGSIMATISVVMMAKPDAWARCIVLYSRMPYMHLLEILIRVGFGILFLIYADDAKFPLTIEILGYVLLAVGVGLMLTPPSSHRRFAVWSVEKFSKYFRPAGLVSFAFGMFVIYAAI